MNLVREAKLYPNKSQIIVLEALLEQSRLLYNHCLELKKISWIDRQEKISRFQLQKIVIDFGSMPASLRQMVVYRLNTAYINFFRHNGYPRFKKFGRYRSLELRQYGTDYKISGNHLSVWKSFGIGNIKFRGLQELNDPSQARIVKRATGWYLQVIDEIAEKSPCKVKSAVGIDLGVKHLVVDTTGYKVEPPKLFKKDGILLAHHQRIAAKKKKGSNRQKKYYNLVARTHERIANQRRDFLHKLSNQYASMYDMVAVEDLNVAGLIRNHHLTRSIADASWTIFTNMLSYKLKMLGKHLVKIDPRYTSQECSSCGEIVKKSLSIRTHSCLNCGLVLDRDENASRNIIIKGLGKANGEGIALASSLTRKILKDMPRTVSTGNKVIPVSNGAVSISTGMTLLGRCNPISSD